MPIEIPIYAARDGIVMSVDYGNFFTWKLNCY
jgi:hypothetical protein